MKEADGIVIGTPVYYSGANGALCALLDRIFYSGGNQLAGKPAAAVVSARRSGTTAAFQRINQYFAIKKMPIVSGTKDAALLAMAPLYVAKKTIVRTSAKTMLATAR
jgi:multimeric flavodoxin WrbA